MLKAITYKLRASAMQGAIQIANLLIVGWPANVNRILIMLKLVTKAVWLEVDFRPLLKFILMLVILLA
jgi:hypothetical protein